MKVEAGRIVRLAAAGGALAGAAVATAAAANPIVRDEVRRLRRLAQPLGSSEPGPPVAPPLPPGRTVVLPGRGEVFVRDSGPPGETAAAVLLLHGWTLSADLNFFALYDQLAGYRVIALDHRGHGRGMRSRQAFTLEDCADDAAALLDLLGVSPAVVVGFSMGGAVAMLLWSRHRKRVGSCWPPRPWSGGRAPGNDWCGEA
jgi:3-oxoadipate enol-lactonase